MASKGKRFADDGWAIWINGNDTSIANFYLWVNPKGDSYVDLVLRVGDIMGTNKLNIYVPFILEHDDIEDISVKLNDEKVLRGIFNSSCLCDFKKNPCTSEIAFSGQIVDLVHIRELGFQAEQMNEGTMITASIEDLKPYLDNDDAFIMLRIPQKSLNCIFKPQVNVKGFFSKLRDLVTSPIVEEQYSYSVRINEGRLLPTEITRIGSFHRERISRAVINIFLHEDYGMNDSNCYRVSRLEQELYEDYAPETFPVEGAISYQWVQTREVEEKGQYNFFFEMEHKVISKSSFFVYMIIVVFLGASGSAMWDFIKLLYGLLF